MINELEWILKEVAMAKSRYYREINLQGLRQTTKNFRIVGVPASFEPSDFRVQL
jgi:hypothetical protein